MIHAGDFTSCIADVRYSTEGIGNRDQFVRDSITTSIGIGQGCRIAIGVNNTGQQAES